MTYPPGPHRPPHHGQARHAPGQYHGQQGHTHGVSLYGTPGGDPPRQEEGQATAAMICSIVGFASCLPPLAIVGVVLGHLARGKAKRGEANGRGTALAGIIVGYAASAVFVAIALVVIAVNVWAD